MTEGWAALQHHVILRTTLTLFPPSLGETSSTLHIDPRVLVELKQGSYFTMKPKHCPANFVPRWFVGNIYDLERAVPACVDLSGPISTTDPLEYELFVSGDYEVTVLHCFMRRVCSTIRIDKAVWRPTDSFGRCSEIEYLSQH